MAFTFTVASNTLVISNSTDTPTVRIALVHPIVELAEDKIYVHDNFGVWGRTFRFSDFGTIAGVAPTSMDDAYTKLLVLQNTVNTSSGGGSLPAGAATSENQTTQIDQNTGVVTTAISAPALPYTIPNTFNSFTIITSGDVSVDGVAVPSGSTLTYSCGSNETLTGLDLTTSGGGTVVLLTQTK